MTFLGFAAVLAVLAVGAGLFYAMVMGAWAVSDRLGMGAVGNFSLVVVTGVVTILLMSLWVVVVMPAVVELVRS